MLDMIGIKLFRLILNGEELKDIGRTIRNTLLKYPIDPLSVSDIYDESSDGDATIILKSFYELFDLKREKKVIHFQKMDL